MHLLMQLFEDAQLYRVRQIINDPRTNAYGPLPICETTWFKGVRDGRYPPGRHLSDNVVVWTGRELNELVERIAQSPPARLIPAAQPHQVPTAEKRAPGRPRKNPMPDAPAPRGRCGRRGRQVHDPDDDPCAPPSV